MPQKFVSPGQLPKIGSQCPKCYKDFIRKSKWEGVWCPACKTTFKERELTPISSTTSKNISIRSQQEGFVFIMDEIQALRKEFNERMDNLAKYLLEKLGPPKK